LAISAAKLAAAALAAAGVGFRGTTDEGIAFIAQMYPASRKLHKKWILRLLK
jgi:hypothetical protein